MSRVEKNKGKSKIGIVIVIILLLCAIGGATYYFIKHPLSFSKETSNPAEVATPEPSPEPKKLETFVGTDRPIAVMIDNNTNAWPQAGIDQAYIVYEIIVEGGETRLMAIFKGKDLEKIGPVRSSRHYFLDYAMENDALYAHYGWSPQAQSDISKYKINNMNGIYEDATFWRDNTRYAPHNALTSTKRILESAAYHGYRTTSDATSVLQYTTDEVKLEDGKDATDIIIPYNSYNVIEYVYNPETGRYTKYAKDEKQTEWVTGQDLTCKNIIITFASNYTLTDAENKGRQGVNNIGKLKGYYITNGKAIEITCEKTSRESKTKYCDLEGNEIKVNDGNTFVQIIPTSSEVEFKNPTPATPVATSTPNE